MSTHWEDRRAAFIASTQHGLLTLQQALGLGFTENDIQYRIACGRWRRVLPHVYAINGSPPTWHQAVMAAVIWAGDGAAASGETAARLWDVPAFVGEKIEISAPRILRAYGLPFRVRRVDHMLRGRVHIVDGIPCTSPERTLFDLAGRKDGRVPGALDYFIRRKMIEPWQVYAEAVHPDMKGRRGVRIMRELLIPRIQDLAPTDSDLERTAERILLARGLPQPVRQFGFEATSDITIHFDLAFPSAKLAIECDGGGHLNPDQKAKDSWRDSKAALQGWLTLRPTRLTLTVGAEEWADTVFELYHQRRVLT